MLGLSVDSTACLKAWADSLGGITYPLLSDFYPHGGIARLYGVLRPEGYSERALFVIDKQGVIRYVDVHDIDTQPDNEVLFAELARLEPEKSRAVAAATAAAAQAQPAFVEPDAEVILYCTPWCPDCRRAKVLFKENDIAYEEIDITKNRAAAGKVREYARGFETTPTFKIKGQVIVGFDRRKIGGLLGIKVDL